MAGHDAGDALIDALVCLGNSGVNVALNDFGTGHANPVQLRGLPANIVKIDRSHIVCLSELACNQQVVAEGVENGVQRQLPTCVGCDLAHGGLFGQPQPQPLPLTRRAAA